MGSLLDLQRDIRAAVLAGDDGAATAAARVIGGAIGAAGRLRIYRNNVLGNLTGALRLTFPAVERLVGADFFAAAAARFIAAGPPADADLYRYGAAFPDFLAGFEPARGVAYLADVARLEWAVGKALHAPATPPLAVDALGGIARSHHADLTFAAHPSLSLLALAHPAKAVWEAVLTEDAEQRAAALAAIDLAAPGDRLAVLHGAAGLAVLRLSPAAHAFAAALIAGRGLADALDACASEDAAVLLGEFIAHGFFARCEPRPNQSTSHQDECA